MPKPKRPEKDDEYHTEHKLSAYSGNYRINPQGTYYLCGNFLSKTYVSFAMEGSLCRTTMLHGDWRIVDAGTINVHTQRNDSEPLLSRTHVVHDDGLVQLWFLLQFEVPTKWEAIR